MTTNLISAFFVVLMVPFLVMASDLCTKNLVSTTATNDPYLKLISRAKMRTPDLPVQMPYAARDLAPGEFMKSLELSEISWADLGYETAIRKSTFSPAAFQTQLGQLPAIELADVSDVLLWDKSLEARPKNAFARLAQLKSGRIVAIVSYRGEAGQYLNRGQFFNRVGSAYLLSELGIGPLFYGVVAGQKYPSYVVDLVPGSRPTAENTTPDTWSDRREIMQRLRSVGISYHMDYQESVTLGRVMIVDADGYLNLANFQKPAHFNWNSLFDWTYRFVAMALAAIRSEDLRIFLDQLRSKDPLFAEEIGKIVNAFFFHQVQGSIPGQSAYEFRRFLN